MKKMVDLTAADFTSINEEYFKAWKDAEIAFTRYSLPCLGIGTLLVLASAFGIVSGFLVIALYLILFIISLIFSLKAIKYRKLLGISKAAISKALKG